MSGHAELGEVWPRDGRIRLVGHLHDPPHPAGGPADGWALLLALREDGRRLLHYPAPLDGERFDVSFPVADLVSGGLRPPATWDAYLAPPGGDVRLRVGRLLDDIRDKKRIMVFPAQPTAGATGPTLVRPYYTIKENLSVRCWLEETR